MAYKVIHQASETELMKLVTFDFLNKLGGAY